MVSLKFPNFINNLVNGYFFLADIVVGYNQTFYSTTEGNVSVTICVVIFEPQTGGSPRPFTLSYNTENYTAGKT